MVKSMSSRNIGVFLTYLIFEIKKSNSLDLQCLQVNSKRIAFKTNNFHFVVGAFPERRLLAGCKMVRLFHGKFGSVTPKQSTRDMLLR